MGIKTFNKVETPEDEMWNAPFWTPKEGDTLICYMKRRNQGTTRKADGTEFQYDLACVEMATKEGVRTGKIVKINVNTVLRRKLAVIDATNKLLMFEYKGELDPKPGMNPTKLYEVYVAED